MIFQAGLVSLLRTVFVLLLLYYGIRLFFRYIYPYLTNSSNSKSNFNPKETKANKMPSDTLGEYVDYEEIKEDKKD